LVAPIRGYWSYQYEAIGRTNTDNLLLLSVITKIEVLGFPASDRLRVDFVDIATILNLNSNVVNQTISLRKSHKIKLGGAIIAATAIVYSLTLVTRNVDDFRKIGNLIILNPWDLKM
jgi:predicted nucleic acid-binding protein